MTRLSYLRATKKESVCASKQRRSPLLSIFTKYRRTFLLRRDFEFTFFFDAAEQFNAK